MIFTKAHGLGNDFVITDGRALAEDYEKYSALSRRLCHRRTGVGADGLILVRNSKACDIRMQIFNSDGSEAEMCGNGIRCFAKYVYDKNILHQEHMTVETLAGTQIIDLTIENGVAVAARVNLGKPFLEKKDIPMLGEGQCRLEKLTALGREFTFSTILLGVPHTVVYVDEMLSAEDINRYGREIENMPLFPRKTNVNFTRVIDGENLEVRTWERGCGATYACGTGSSSTAVCSYIAGKTGRKVNVHLELGVLNIEYAEDGCAYMTGPAAFSFEGEVEA